MTQMLGDMDRLFDILDRETQVKTKQIQEQAEQESDRIIKEAKREAQSIRQRILQEAQNKAAQKQTAQRAQLAQQEKKEQLQTREDLLDRVWARAEEMLHDLVESKDYQEVLHQLARQGLELLGPGKYQLAADPHGHSLLTKDRLQAWASAWNESHQETVNLQKRSDPADTWGGLIIEDQKRPRRVDLTMPTRLADAREELAEQVYTILTKKHE